MNRQRVDVEKWSPRMLLLDIPDEGIASSTEFDSVTNKNRLKSQRGSICHSSGQRRDLSDDSQIIGKDLTRLKTIAVDIGSETSLDYLSMPRRNTEWRATGNGFEDVVGFGELPFNGHSSRISRQ
jgi:hypothetical protein